MTKPNDINTTGIDKVKTYLQGLGIDTSKLNQKQIQSIFAEADKDNDGEITQSEFSAAASLILDTVINEDTITMAEEEFLLAWEALSGADGDKETISEYDIEQLNLDEEPTTPQKPNNNVNNSSSSGSPTPTPPAGPKDPAGDKDDVPSTDDGKGSATVSFTGTETAEQLNAEKAKLVTDLQELRSGKELSAAHATMTEEEGKYKTALDTLAKSNEQYKTDLEKLNTTRTELETAVTNQEEIVKTAEESCGQKEDSYNSAVTAKQVAQTNVTAAKQEIVGLGSAPEKTISIDTDGDGETDKTETNPAYTEYVDNLAKAKEKLNEAEIALENAQGAEETAKAELEEAEKLVATENENLIKSQNSLNEQDKAIVEFITTSGLAETEQGAAVIAAYGNYEEARNNYEKIQTQRNSDISTLRANIKAYDVAIDDANKREKEAVDAEYALEEEKRNEILKAEGYDPETGKKIEEEPTTQAEEEVEEVEEVGEAEEVEEDNTPSITIKKDEEEAPAGETPAEEVPLVDEETLAEYKQVGVNDEQGESFVEYLNSMNLNINKLTEEQLEANKKDYETRIAQRNEFMELCAEFESNPELQEFLNEDISSIDTNNQYRRNISTLSELQSQVEKFGSFISGSENANYNYNTMFAEMMPSVLEQMRGIKESVETFEEMESGTVVATDSEEGKTDAEGTYTPQDVIDYDETLRAATEHDGEESVLLQDDLPVDRKEMLDVLIDTYGVATNAEQLDLNRTYQTGTVLQETYRLDEETEKLKELLHNVIGENPEGILTSYYQENPEHEQYFQETFGEPSYEALEKVVSMIDEKDFDSAEEASAALLYSCDCNVDTLAENFRKLPYAFFGLIDVQKDSLPPIMDIFAGELPYEVAVPNDDLGVTSLLNEFDSEATSFYANKLDNKFLNAEYDEIKDVLNTALEDSNVSLNDKMLIFDYLLESNSQFMEEYVTYPDSTEMGISYNNKYIADILSEASQDETITVDSVISLMDKFNSVLQNNTDYPTIESFMSAPNNADENTLRKYADTIATLYKKATPEEKTTLIQNFDLGLIFENAYYGDEKEEAVQELFENTLNGSDFNYNEFLEKYPEIETIFTEAFGEKNENTFGDVITAINNGNFQSNDIARFALLYACDGNIETLSSNFRDLKVSDEITMLPKLLSILNGELPYATEQNPSIEEIISEYTTRTQQKDEFLALYEEFENDPELQKYLNEDFESIDTEEYGTTIETLKEIKNFVDKYGVFVDGSENADFDFNTMFSEMIPAAIEKLNSLKELGITIEDMANGTLVPTAEDPTATIITEETEETGATEVTGTTATQASEATTEPTIEVTEASEATTEPTIEATEASEATTEPTIEATEASEATTEPTIEATQPTYTVQNVIEIDAAVREEAEYYEEESILGQDISPVEDEVIAGIVTDAYAVATDEEKQILNDTYAVGTYYQEEYRFDEETEKIRELFTNVVGDGSEEFLAGFYQSNPEHEQYFQEKFGEPGKDALYNVVIELENQDFISADEAKAALLYSCNCDVNILTENFRDLPYEFFGWVDVQKDALPPLMDVFAGKLPYEVAVLNDDLGLTGLAEEFTSETTMEYANILDNKLINGEFYEIRDALNATLKDETVSTNDKIIVLNNLLTNNSEFMSNYLLTYTHSDLGNEGFNNQYIANIISQATAENIDTDVILSIVDSVLYTFEEQGMDMTFEEYMKKGNNDSYEKYADSLIALYERATEEEKEMLLNNYKLYSVVQDAFSGKDEDERIGKLFTIALQNNDPMTLMNDYFEAHPTHKEMLDNYFIDLMAEGNMVSPFNGILNAIENKKFNTAESAMVALFYASEGDLTTFITNFRCTGNKVQENNLPMIMNLLQGELPYEVEETLWTDIFTNETTLYYANQIEMQLADQKHTETINTLNEALENEDILPSEKIEIMNHILETAPEFVYTYLETITIDEFGYENYSNTNVANLILEAAEDENTNVDDVIYLLQGIESYVKELNPEWNFADYMIYTGVSYLPAEKYNDAILALFENATQEQKYELTHLVELNEGSEKNLTQYLYSKKNETTKLKEMFNNMNANIPSEINLTAEEQSNLPSTKNMDVYDIIDLYNNNEISAKQAMYLLKETYRSTDAMVDAFRDEKGQMQEAGIVPLMEIFSYLN